MCMPDRVTGQDQDKHAKQSEEWSFTASRDSLTKQPDLATLVLRLGAAVNAIHAAQRWFQACKEACGVAFGLC